MLITLAISFLTYFCMILFTKYRTPIAVLGAAILLIYGSFSGSFSSAKVFQKFPTEIEILIVVLALFSKIFERSGVLNTIAEKIQKLSQGKKVLALILIPFTIYSTSLFMNNLSVILLFTVICLELSIRLRLPIIPLMVSSIIASNIGGCPLPWADTPAVILTLYTDFNLMDFLGTLFIPCIVLEVFLILYTWVWAKRSSKDKDIEPTQAQLQMSAPMHHFPKPPHLAHLKDENKNVRYSVYLFILLIAGICIGPFINLSIAFISLFFGGLLLVIRKENPEDTLNTLPILDSLVFIASLFLIAGALEYSGALKSFVDYIIALSGNNGFLILICIMLSAFVIATFLSAGPAAATILPVCQQLSPLVGGKLVYTALALGILAGSSMLPWSATGGPIMLSEISHFIRPPHIPEEEKAKISRIFDLKSYTAFSIPFSLVMLVISTIFLALYYF